MRYLILGLTLTTSLAAPLRAEDAAAAPAAAAPAATTAQKAEAAVFTLSSSVLTWFQHVKEGLAESSVATRRQHGRITAVAAVRGEGQEDVDPSQPVWKSAVAGKKSKAFRAQRKELSAAVDAILAGNYDEGRQKLDAFEKAHAKSPMLADAREIRGKLDDAVAQAGKAKP